MELDVCYLETSDVIEICVNDNILNIQRDQVRHLICLLQAKLEVIESEEAIRPCQCGSGQEWVSCSQQSCCG